MELIPAPPSHAISLPYYYYYYHLCRYYNQYSSSLLLPPHNYVHWSQTSDSHLYSANLPGVRKEDIKVEVEDSRYLIIRTADDDDYNHANSIGRMKFTRKFRLPKMVDVDAISASYEDGVLTVRVPRALPSAEPAIAAEEGNSVARAA
ncbi:18.8 kDa class V heat shock protein [Iris pallida]|uniref:18.8 kDa class V heat shock protein n=1 Tax=Iris pallida TaxID=29817 RepID=A0AAX6GMB3_IRIPA|nr:18.8 kDa class V heat shock protein [Iris pallida]